MSQIYWLPRSNIVVEEFYNRDVPGKLSTTDLSVGSIVCWGELLLRT